MILYQANMIQGANSDLHPTDQMLKDIPKSRGSPALRHASNWKEYGLTLQLLPASSSNGVCFSGSSHDGK